MYVNQVLTNFYWEKADELSSVKNPCACAKLYIPTKLCAIITNLY